MTGWKAVVGGTLALAQSTSVQAETLRWNCDYATIATPKGLAAEKFALEFALDTITKKAVTIGNAGMSDVAAVGGSQADYLSGNAGQRRRANYHNSERCFIGSQPPHHDGRKADAIAVLRDLQIKFAVFVFGLLSLTCPGECSV